MYKPISATQASKKLIKDLGLEGRVKYGFGRQVISTFFDQVRQVGNATYWEPKVNYLKLIQENGTINDVKHRIKSIVSNKKYWSKSIEEFIPSKIDRKNLYLKVFKEMVNRKKEKSPLPKVYLLTIIATEIGHWDSKGRGLKIS